MKEIGAIFVVSISGICTVQLAASKRCYRTIISPFFFQASSKLRKTLVIIYLNAHHKHSSFLTIFKGLFLDNVSRISIFHIASFDLRCKQFLFIKNSIEKHLLIFSNNS